MNRREFRQVEAERIAREKQEAERLRLQQEAELIATVDADAEFAAYIAAIKQAAPRWSLASWHSFAGCPNGKGHLRTA